MIRMQVQFNEHQIEALRDQASRSQASVSDLVRRALDTWLEGQEAPGAEIQRERAMAAAGRFASGRQDVAERHDHCLADSFGP